MKLAIILGLISIIAIVIGWLGLPLTFLLTTNPVLGFLISLGLLIGGIIGLVIALIIGVITK